jgi:chaperonin GroES
MEVKPIRGNVLVRRSSSDEVRRPSGLIVLQTEKPAEGEVVAVGEGALMFDGSVAQLIVEVGDKVLFKRGAGLEVKVDDSDCLIMSESEILAVIVQ